MIFNNKVYDALKWIALILLPALAVLYVKLAPVWQWPYPDQIVDTIIAVDLFLGTLLGISNIQYKNKEGITDDTEGGE